MNSSIKRYFCEKGMRGNILYIQPQTQSRSPIYFERKKDDPAFRCHHKQFINQYKSLLLVVGKRAVDLLESRRL